MVEVVESYLCSKSGEPGGGEDRLVWGPYFFGVVDGATDKTGHNWGTRTEPMSGGAALANIIKKVLEDPLCGSASPEDLVSRINREIEAAARRAGIDLSDINNRAAAGFAAYAPGRNAIFHIHDCNFGFLLANGEFQARDQERSFYGLAAELRAAVIRWFLDLGEDPFREGRDPGREFIWDLLQRIPEIQNEFHQEGDWRPGIPYRLVRHKALNGLPTSLDVAPVPEGTKEIVLASDGFPFIRPTLEETRAFLEAGLRVDPYRIGAFKSTKGRAPGNISFDDVSYIRLRVDE